MAMKDLWRALQLQKNREFILGESKAEQNAVHHKGEAYGARVEPNLGFSPQRSLDENERTLKGLFFSPENGDFKMRKFSSGGRKMFIAYMEGMTERKVINDMIIRPLMRHKCLSLAYAMDHILPVDFAELEKNGKKMVISILEGMTLLMVDGEREGILIETKNLTKRSVGSPENEKILRGPQQGFIEDLRTNVNLIRNIVRTPDFITRFFPLGGDNNLKCALLYRHGVTNRKLLNEIIQRIQAIQDRGGLMLGEAMLEKLIDPRKFSLIPQTLHTERPDRTAAFVTQGHIAIICDGSPYAMILPITFFSLMHTSEDYFQRIQFANLIRIIRYVAILISILLPGLYVALMTFHSEMVSTSFVVSTVALRQMVSMPVVFEILIMSVIFELVQEASVRVQGGISQSIGIIGSLIMGQAAVSANIVSPIAIIIIALTGICSYAIPDYSLGMSTYILRLGFLGLGAIFGFPGIAIGMVILMGYLCNLTCFGVPFFAPFAPKQRMNDHVFLAPTKAGGKDIPDFINAGEEDE